MERPSVSTDRIQNWYSFRGPPDCDLSKKSRKTLGGGTLVSLASSSSSFYLFHSKPSLSLFLPSMANDSCCNRCQDASLPRAIIQWPPLFLRRLSRADRQERRSSGNYGLSRCALDNQPEDVRGYTRLSQCRLEISSRDNSSINRFWRGLAWPSEAERQDALRARWRI